jgi:fatty acid desaturase
LFLIAQSLVFFAFGFNRVTFWIIIIILVVLFFFFFFFFRLHMYKAIINKREQAHGFVEKQETVSIDALLNVIW